MNKNKTALLCLGILLSSHLYGQTIHVPLGTLPMLFNGGFAGEGEHPRIAAGGNWFHRTPKNFISTYLDQSVGYFASYDQFVSKIRTGIGVTMSQEHLNHMSSSGTVSETRTQFLFSISPKFSFKGKYTFAPFVDYNFGYTKDKGSALQSLYEGSSGSLRTGFLFNTRKFYGGLTVYALNTGKFVPAYPFYNIKNINLFRLQAGYTFEKTPESNFSFTPQVAMLIANGKITRQVEVNLMFRHKKFIWSLNNLHGLGLGYQSKKFKILLSYSISYSGYFGSVSHGSLATRYILK